MISVCMATYNGERYLRQQLDSILACLSKEDELVVSDDGSTDATLDILYDYAKKSHIRLRIFDGPHRGVITNFNNALENAEGSIIFFSDQDDIWHPDKVEKVMETFLSSNCSVVVHNARLDGSNGEPLGKTLYESRQSRPGFIKNFIKNSYVGCCMALRCSLLPVVLPLPENVEMHDWWIGLVSDIVSKSVFIEDPLIDYRRHSGNVSRMTHYSVPKMFQIRMTLICELVKREKELAK